MRKILSGLGDGLLLLVGLLGAALLVLRLVGVQFFAVQTGSMGYPPKTESKTCTLTVSKEIFSATGYELPTTQTFTYRLQLAGKDYANEAYSVYNSSDNSMVSSGTTNSSGEFTLTGGQYAKFENVKTEQEYTVYEYAKSGWWCVGGKSGSTSDGKITYADSRTGVTQEPTSEQFQNRCGSFLVKKFVSDGQDAGDLSFRFLLKDASGNAWANQSYYIYNTNGKLVKTAVQKTASDGSFTLQANQAAMFVGIESGTKYTVEEASSPLYDLVSPKNGSYTKTVGETVESLPFTNNLLENQGLYVRKLANNASDANALYTFKLVKVTNGSETDVTANAVDDTGTAISFDETAHTFQLKSGQYAHFTKLTDGEYRVYEYNLDKKVIATATYTNASSASSEMAFTVSDADGSRTAELTNTFTVDADQSQELLVTNDYTQAMFRISKTILDYKGENLQADGSGSGNSHINAGGDTSQRFVYRIDKYASRADWENGAAPSVTTYTDFSCDETGNGSVLVQGSGDGWYVITELDTWSDTDYDYSTQAYQGITPNNSAYTKSDAKYVVAFELEEVYDAYNLPTAHFENRESLYAYRSGQAYAENQITPGY